MMTITEAIASGKYDASLTRMEEAIKRRRYEMVIEKLHVGSRVRVPRGTRPSYLAGWMGTVVEFRRTKLLVRLDNPETLPYRKFRGGLVVRPEQIEVVGE
jgi:hypothetical protein